ncbi:unnamed protein product [Fraxinus pennsylvanica]|uniref:Uncharacterized protein n=1 Tax=Fraxinus pennsylvanica TaxID=56036 RepID=A0AAD1ZZ06_9LAMI|nr:unnamed protein product [Fraxinus pennsylvanica]
MYDTYNKSGELIPTNKWHNSVKIFSHLDVALENHGIVLSKNTSFCNRMLSGPLDSPREVIPDLRITKIGMSIRFTILAFSKLVRNAGTRLGDAFLHQLPHAFGGMNGSVVYELDRPENVGPKKSLKDKGRVWYSTAAFSTTSGSIR